jgi:hypothetical protein
LPETVLGIGALCHLIFEQQISLGERFGTLTKLMVGASQLRLRNAKASDY